MRFHPALFNQNYGGGASGPPPDSNYDTEILSTGPMFGVKGNYTTTPTWPDAATVFAGDYADESQYGSYWYEAWSAGSGQAPATYDATSSYTSPMLRIEETTEAPVWPSFTAVSAGDYANESVAGGYWFTAWFTESGNAPADYETYLTTTGLEIQVDDVVTTV